MRRIAQTGVIDGIEAIDRGNVTAGDRVSL